LQPRLRLLLYVLLLLLLLLLLRAPISCWRLLRLLFCLLLHILVWAVLDQVALRTATCRLADSIQIWHWNVVSACRTKRIAAGHSCTGVYQCSMCGCATACCCRLQAGASVLRPAERHTQPVGDCPSQLRDTKPVQSAVLLLLHDHCDHLFCVGGCRGRWLVAFCRRTNSMLKGSPPPASIVLQ
jgi:hypothetical protein